MMGIELALFAQSLTASNLSVLPCLETKRPAIQAWKPYITRKMTDDECLLHFDDGKGLGIICGSISNHLEVLDFDVPNKDGKLPEHYKAFCELCKEYGLGDLLKTLPIAKTPSNGRHIYFRCIGYTDKNQKLANTEDGRVMIETRGEGGYVLAAPSAGYEWKQGNLYKIPEITKEQRDLIIALAVSLSVKPVEVVQQERITPLLPSGDRPGDRYNREADVRALLNKHGWQFKNMSGNRENWVRPGKTVRDEPGGTLTTDNPPTFYVFTTNAHPLMSTKGYSPFSLLVALDYAGDVSRAAKDLMQSQNPATGRTDGKKTYFEKPTYKTEPDFDGFDIVTPEELTDKDAEFGLCGRLFLNGQLNLLEAEEGVGKTTFLLWVAANGSNGIDPIGQFGGMEPIQRFKTILFAREDDAAFYAKIYRKLGGQPGYLQIVTNGFELTTSVQIKLAKQIQKSEAKLVAFDPMMSYIPQGMDMNSNTDMNRFFGSLRDVAMNTNSCIVAVRHWTKPPGGKVAIKDIRFRGMGATAWRSTARSQISLAWHPDIKGLVLVMHTKGSIDSGQDSLFGFKRSMDGLNLYLPSSPEIQQLEVGA